MGRAMGAAKVPPLACAGLVEILVAVALAAPGLRDEPSFQLSGGGAVVPATACSAFLLWRERRPQPPGVARRQAGEPRPPLRRGRRVDLEGVVLHTRPVSLLLSPGTYCPPRSFPSSEPEPRVQNREASTGTEQVGLIWALGDACGAD